MSARWIVGLSVLVAIGCGGAPSAPRGPDEVTAEWTSGDDAPLEGAAPAPKAVPTPRVRASCL